MDTQSDTWTAAIVLGAASVGYLARAVLLLVKEKDGKRDADRSDEAAAGFRGMVHEQHDQQRDMLHKIMDLEMKQAQALSRLDERFERLVAVLERMAASDEKQAERLVRISSQVESTSRLLDRRDGPPK